MKETIAEYKKLLEAGNNLEVIEKFYAEDIEQVENNDAPVTGKETLMLLEKKNIEGVLGFSIKVERMIIDEEQGLAMGEMNIVFHSKKSGRKKLPEASIQVWKNNRIIYQRFYYKEATDAY